MRREHAQLQRIIAKANLDRTFRNRLLNGDRSQLLAPFDLSGYERAALLAIEADTLEAFAEQVARWMTQRTDGADQAREQPVSVRYPSAISMSV